MDRRLRLAAYWVAALLHTAGWSVYYSVSRMIIVETSRLMLLVALETLPLAISIPASSIASRRGYKLLLPLGFIEAAGLAAFSLPWPASVAGVAVASIAWSAAGLAILSAILESTGTGVSLGAVLSATAVGWSLGGLTGPLLYTTLGLRGATIASSLMVALCYSLLAPVLPETAAKPGGSRVGALETLAYSLALAPLVTAMETAFSLVMSRLSSCLGPLLYAAVLAATGLTSAIGKPIAGALIEKLGAETVYYSSFIAYSAWMASASLAPCTLLAGLFATPIYPFYEVGFYSHASRLLGERRASAAWAASYTAAGAAILALRELRLGYENLMILSSFLALSSLASTAAVDRWVTRRLVAAQAGRSDAEHLPRVHGAAGGGAAGRQPGGLGEGEG